MKYIPFIIMLIGASIATYANDPFDKAQRQTRTAHSEENNRIHHSNRCHTNEDAIFTDTPFNQLKIVGILQYKDQPQIFLVDKNNVVHSATEGRFVAQERLRIQNITPRHIRFQQWNNANCEEPQSFIIKF